MIGDFVKGDVRAEIALQLPRTKLCCVLLGETPLRQSRIVDRRNARSARTSPPTDRTKYIKSNPEFLFISRLTKSPIPLNHSVYFS